ncbi:MAG: glycosyltransferase family 4 protein [Ardenticatenales bacterium]|nr:glycosyltransferase family 4 protein [Ardenticatenales bacterium]
MTTLVRVLHPITRLIIGGAQENTMLTAAMLNHDPTYRGRYAVDVVCGPQTGTEGSLIEETRSRGVPLTILPDLVRQISLSHDTRAFFKLRRMMRQGHYDIVHTHSSKAGVLGRLAARSAGIPHIIHTVHGWSFHDQMSPAQLRLYVALEKLGAWAGHVMIVVSPHDIDKGLAQGIGRRQDYVVIRSGVELDRFGHPQVSPEEMRARLGVPPTAPLVGSVTRLSPQKAPLHLVAAYAQTAAHCPQAWFVIVGDGPLRPDVEAALQTAGIADRTLLTGLRRDVPELMAAFDVFVLSSLWEGLPRVLPQAMATRLPIVATAADGSAEAIADGVNGYLVTRGDTAAMAERIAQLLADEALRQRMGAAGQARAAEFGAARMVSQIDALYQQLGFAPN